MILTSVILLCDDNCSNISSFRTRFFKSNSQTAVLKDLHLTYFTILLFIIILREFLYATIHCQTTYRFNCCVRMKTADLCFYAFESYTIIPPPDGQWGIEDANGSWSGMIGQIVRKVSGPAKCQRLYDACRALKTISCMQHLIFGAKICK